MFNETITYKLVTANKKESEKLAEKLDKTYDLMAKNVSDYNNRAEKTLDLNLMDKTREKRMVYHELSLLCLKYSLCSRRSLKLRNELTQTIKKAEFMGLNVY